MKLSYYSECPFSFLQWNQILNLCSSLSALFYHEHVSSEGKRSKILQDKPAIRTMRWCLFVYKINENYNWWDHCLVKCLSKWNGKYAHSMGNKADSQWQWNKITYTSAADIIYCIFHWCFLTTMPIYYKPCITITACNACTFLLLLILEASALQETQLTFWHGTCGENVFLPYF